MPLHVKRVYAQPASSDGYRVLVDRVWPRGLSKAKAKVDLWLKEVAPSTPLRQWFKHDPAKWDEFRGRYFRELQTRDAAVGELRRQAGSKPVTLLFAARDEQHNNAVALKEYLQDRP